MKREITGIIELLFICAFALTGCSKEQPVNVVIPGIIEAEDQAYEGAEEEKIGDRTSVNITEEYGTIDFDIEAEASGFYTLSFDCYGHDADKYNELYVDGEKIGGFISPNNTWAAESFESVYLNAGEHEITVMAVSGWSSIDHMEAVCTLEKEPEVFFENVSAEPSNPKTNEKTKKILQYLVDQYGKSVIAGQESEEGVRGENFTAVYERTGKVPALLGIDLEFCTQNMIDYGFDSDYAVEGAIEFSEMGGLVTACWLWHAPNQYLTQPIDECWWNSMRTEYVTLDLKSVMDGEDPEAYALLMQDIDDIAERLCILRDADVTVLFRPIHEAANGWFWWGTDRDAYLKLWQLIYKKYTEEYDLSNLIWVWNGEDPDWYPGDAYVDIISYDIYLEANNYNPSSNTFHNIASSGKVNKITAMNETGTLFDIDAAQEKGAMWSYFCMWKKLQDDTEDGKWDSVYSDERVITLDKLPFHSHVDKDGDKYCDQCSAKMSEE